MRVLVANIPLPQNRFLVDLNHALSGHCELTHSSDAFWDMTGAFDVVHLHFPEYLTFKHQQAYREGLTEELILHTEQRLRHWSGRARIVVTRHVLLPHDALSDPMWERMYQTVYAFADGVVHFAQASIDEFQERYAAIDFRRGDPPVHAIVPHHNYASLPCVVTREEARAFLGIARDARVVLVFGGIRSEAERRLILDTFRNLQLPRKVLLVGSWPEQLPNVSWIRLKYWLRDLKRLYFRCHPRYHLNYGFVEEAETQHYLMAADVLFIPRFQVLNSGNVTLGMTFGRIVVGPDSWNVGELLRCTDNPVFDPDVPESAADAVAEGFKLSAANVRGPANRALALTEFDVEWCARKYIELFCEVSTWPGRQTA